MQMDELNFLSPSAASPAQQNQTGFDSATALAFFESHGKVQEIAADEVIFSENEKSNAFLFQRSKMYLLLEGEIELSVQGNAVGTVQAGEIFGEMASITQLPRSATATTLIDCRVISLDDKQFKNALADTPEFALTLMVLMTRRLRAMVAKLNASNALAMHFDTEGYPVLDKKLLAELEDELGENAVMRYAENKYIMQQGQAGVFMYIVLEGQINIVMQNQVVEKIGPGGIFGELALVERTERLASAIAFDDCAVLAINRATFIELVKENPAFGLAILSAIGERLRFVISLIAEHSEA